MEMSQSEVWLRIYTALLTGRDRDSENVANAADVYLARYNERSKDLDRLEREKAEALADLEILRYQNNELFVLARDLRHCIDRLDPAMQDAADLSRINAATQFQAQIIILDGSTYRVVPRGMTLEAIREVEQRRR